MIPIDLKNRLTFSNSLAPASRTATANGTGVDLQGYVGDAVAILNSAAGTGTTPTLAVKIQDSADNSAFADVAGYTFTTVTDAAASLQTLKVDTRLARRYVRAVATIGGTTPVFVSGVTLAGTKQVL